MLTNTVLREQLNRLDMKPSALAIRNINRALDGMQTHQLDATLLDYYQGALRILWLGEFNSHREVSMNFTNGGLVICFAYEHSVMTKMWDVSDLANETRTVLTLTLSESLEFIRHSIWANHDV